MKVFAVTAKEKKVRKQTMREILFRGKLKSDNGKNKKGDWVFGDLVRIKDGDHIHTYIYGFGEVDPSTVGQFTGLYDGTKWEELTTEEQAFFLYPANGGKRSKEEWKGKPIFEGNIVNFKTTAYHFKNCRIKYRICYAKYCAIDNDGYEYPMDKTFKYEVIGSIHDNPELLERG